MTQENKKFLFKLLGYGKVTSFVVGLGSWFIKPNLNQTTKLAS